MTGFTFIDAIAFIWFLACWSGYTVFADREAGGRRSLKAVMDAYRLAWMTRMLARDNRMVDASILGNLSRSVTFFASTTMFILAGLIAVLGVREQAMAIVAELPLAVETTRLVWDAKLLLMVMIFVYAFFKFTWSLRQFNYCSVLVGAAPDSLAEAELRSAFAETVSRMSSLGASHFNRGVRAYYFGLAALAWFVHPVLFVAASTWVVLVLYRREFHSNTLKSLGAPE